MEPIPLGVPVRIAGQEVIIFRDMIGAEALNKTRETEIFTVIEPQGSDGRPAIYIDENSLRAARDDYPGIKVYGLWQLLFHNNKVQLGTEAVIYPVGEREGFYLRLDRNGDLNDPASIISSSEYVDNFISELMDVDLSQSVRIEVDIEDLSLPKNPAYTRMELNERQRHEETKRWYLIGVVAACMIVATGVLNWGMHTVYKMKMADYQAKQSLISDLDNRIADLKTERLAVRPDDSDVLDRLFTLFQYDPYITTPISGEDQVGFATEHRLLSSPGLTYELPKVVDGVAANLDIELRYDMRILPGTQGVEAGDEAE